MENTDQAMLQNFVDRYGADCRLQINDDYSSIMADSSYGGRMSFANFTAQHDSNVTLKLRTGAFNELVEHAKIGNDELARQRARCNLPNVQAAYDAYITLLALSQKY